jgi:phosphohistidine phosphatase
MELILWRHAEAEDTTPDMPRELTDKGRKQALHMADWLKVRMPDDTRILVSPAMRTQQTALALGLPFTTLDALTPDARPNDILTAAGWPDGEGTVLVVGHQPTLGMVAARLLSDQHAYWSVKKGAIWWIARRGRNGDAENILKASITPELI